MNVIARRVTVLIAMALVVYLVMPDPPLSIVDIQVETVAPSAEGLTSDEVTDRADQALPSRGDDASHDARETHPIPAPTGTSAEPTSTTREVLRC